MITLSGFLLTFIKSHKEDAFFYQVRPRSLYKDSLSLRSLLLLVPALQEKFEFETPVVTCSGIAIKFNMFFVEIKCNNLCSKTVEATK
jgi:hypothetical protein